MSIQTEQVRVEFVADTSKLKKGSEEAKKNLDSVSGSIENQKESWSRASEAFDKFAPGIKGTTDSISEMSATFSDMFEGVKAGAKGMKLAIVAAIAAVAVKLAKMAWTVASETSRAYNAQEYDKVIERREASMRRLKTSIGAFTAPIVNAINTAIGGILDGVTWVLKKVHAGLSFVYGFLKGLIIPVIDTVKKAIDAVASAIRPIVDGLKNAINGIAQFLGFGPVFKSSAKGAEEASEAIEDVGESSEYAEGALQGFDKLNVMDNLTGDKNTADEIDDTSSAMQELGESLSGKLFDYLGKIPQLLSGIDLGGIWTKFKEGAIQAFNTIKEKLVGFGSWIMSSLSGLGSWIYEKLVGVWNTLSTTMSGVWTWLTTTLGSLWEGLTSVMGTLWEGLTSAMSGIWSGLTSTMSGLWDGLTSTMSGLWEGLTGIMSSLWNTLTTAMGSTWNWLTNLMSSFWNTLTSLMRSAWDTLTSFMRSVMNSLVSFLRSIWSELVSTIRSLWDGATSFIRGLWEGFANFINGGFFDIIRSTVENIVGAFSKAWEIIGDLFDKVISPIKSAVDWLLDKVKWLLDKVSGLKESVSNIGKSVSNIGSSLVNGVKGLFGGANGAVFEPNDPFPIVVGDNTREPEVLSPVSTMKSAFKEAISEMGGVGGSRGSGPIEITLNVDGKALARATYDDLVAEGNRRGRRTIA